jgi:hypothetical protein
VDLRDHAAPGTPSDVLAQLRTDHIVVTYSDVSSSISPAASIEYREILVKIPVSFMGRDFVFPLLTWVSNEYSLIRGYLLGFQKRMIRNDAGPMRLDEGNTVIDFSDGYASADTHATPQPPFGLPFLVHTDFDVGSVASDHRLGELVVKNAHLLRLSRVDGIVDRQVVFGFELRVELAIETEDVFSIHDVRRLETEA